MFSLLCLLIYSFRLKRFGISVPLGQPIGEKKKIQSLRPVGTGYLHDLFKKIMLFIVNFELI